MHNRIYNIRTRINFKLYMCILQRQNNENVYFIICSFTADNPGCILSRLWGIVTIFNEEELVSSVKQQTEKDKVHSFVKFSIMIKGENG